MKQHKTLITALGIILIVSLTACTGQSAGTASLSPTPPSTEGTLSEISMIADSELPTQTPVAQSTPQIPVLRVWWPEELYPHDDQAAEDILLAQFEDFRQTYVSYRLEVRRKHSSGPGGILPTLRTAAPVAPEALPDLTLMRRADMVTAATEGLIIPLAGWVPSDLLDDLLPGGLALGQIDGVQYGLPYALNIYHVVYRTSVFDQPPALFADILAEKPGYLFPAGTEPVSWTVLLQYWAAGGRLVDENGSATLEYDPLLAVLEYYAEGTSAGIFDSALLDYTDFEDYWNQSLSAGIDMAAIDSVTYLYHKNSLLPMGLASTPTTNGQPITALEGWVWVLIAQDSDHQNGARAFLSWMMQIGEQGVFTEALGILPSQKRALRLWDDQTYASFAQTLLAAAEVIPDTQRSNSAAVALAESLAAVLTGTPARSAADEALAKLSE